jgi:hypothetical protein
MQMKNHYEDRIVKITRLLELMNKDKLKKQQILQKRYAKFNNSNMEEQVVNPGRVPEQDIQEGTCRKNLPGKNENMQSLPKD